MALGDFRLRLFAGAGEKTAVLETVVNDRNAYTGHVQLLHPFLDGVCGAGFATHDYWRKETCLDMGHVLLQIRGGCGGLLRKQQSRSTEQNGEGKETRSSKHGEGHLQEVGAIECAAQFSQETQRFDASKIKPLRFFC